MKADNGTGSVNVGRLFYTFPVGDDLTVTAGPVVRTDDAACTPVMPPTTQLT